MRKLFQPCCSPVVLIPLFAVAAGAGVGGAEPTRITLDATQPGATISPLLFGHNVEVTRRGVWRGLSAEMVANRKFAASENDVPKRWTPITDGGPVTLDHHMAYAGAQSVRADVQRAGVCCGIAQVQEALAFQQGGRFTVRLWVRTAADRTLAVRLTDAAGTEVVYETTWPVKAGVWECLVQEFVAARTGTNGRLAITSSEAGPFWIGAVSVQPSHTLRGMRTDVIDLLRQIKPGSLRYPGGCYAEFYRWQDGLLPVDQRPPVGPTGLPFLLPENDDYDTHEIGVDEFIALCRAVGSEPAITVRLSDNTPDDAAAWVEYCNGPPDSQWGRRRAERGHPAPYGVRCWFVGNELYFFGRGGLSDADTAARQTQRFAAAMKQADPSILLTACTRTNGDDWNRQLIAQAGDTLDLFSAHDYLLDHFEGDLAGIARAPTHVLRPLLLTTRAGLQQALPAGRHARIAFDEWNTRWGLAGSVGMGIYTAGVLNLFCREGESLEIDRAYYFMAINEGAIQVGPFNARLDTAGEVFDLYKVHQESHRLPIAAPPADADLDLCASLSADGRHLHVTAVNRSVSHTQVAEFELRGFAGAGACTVESLVPDAIDAAAPGFRRVQESVAVTDGRRAAVTIPPCAIACVRFGAPE